MDNTTLLRTKAFKGLEDRKLHDKKEYVERLEFELKTIEKLGFVPYFLVVQDITNFALDNDVLVGPGRGSCVGSLLCYSIGITSVDPIKYNLYYERFMSADRTSPPDIDIDFSDRDKVIEYIEDRYGKDRVCRVGSLNFLRTKSAIRDIGRVLEKDQKYIEELTNLVPPPVAGLWDSFDAECEVEPKLRDPKYQDIILPLEKLWGITRSYGTHAGGVAIAPGPINQFIPLYKDKNGNPVSQFDYRDLETTGLLKFDILGLKTLKVIQLCIKHIRDSGGSIDLKTLEDRDAAAYKLISKGDLDGIFQLGGEGIKQLTINISPNSLEDLSLINSLFRPGPLSSGLVDDAVAVRQGTKPAKYLHESLVPILEETHSIPCYQEQVMQICTEVCGYTLPESYWVMKCMGKKLKEKLKAERPKFVAGAIKNGVWTAYLKAHYPVEFYAALLACETKPEMIIQYTSSARDSGIEILPPDVNLSGVLHEPEGNAIRFGLGHIKGMPRATAEEIIRIRNEG
jgi:DNA polymerase-3 subunit alpha